MTLFQLRGLDNAGKTTILKRINGEAIDTISPTLGFNIKTLEHEGFKLNIWDVGGQKSIRSYWRNYFEQTDALIWVVDSADRLRLKDCKRELGQLLQEERLAGATLLVFANKQDIAGALTELEIKNVRNERKKNVPEKIKQWDVFRHLDWMLLKVIIGPYLHVVQ